MQDDQNARSGRHNVSHEPQYNDCQQDHEYRPPMLDRRYASCDYGDNAQCTWCIGVLVYWCIGALVYLVYRCIGALVHWCIGASVVWQCGSVAAVSSYHPCLTRLNYLHTCAPTTRRDRQATPFRCMTAVHSPQSVLMI